VVTAALAVVLFANFATAGSTVPADKAAASGNKLVVSNPNQDVVLLSTQVKTSTPEDLAFSVTLECQILTTLTTGTTTPGGNSVAEAQGTVRIWVTFDGQIVPINSSSAPPQSQTGSSPGNDSDKVTFCHNDRSQSVTDTENPGDGTDQLQTYLDTKQANAFNWVWLNAGAAIHTIEVHGELTTSTSSSGTTPGTGTAQAFVGNRTLVVDPTKFANTTTI
jgi:hypothetical protein